MRELLLKHNFEVKKKLSYKMHKKNNSSNIIRICEYINKFHKMLLLIIEPIKAKVLGLSLCMHQSHIENTKEIAQVMHI